MRQQQARPALVSLTPGSALELPPLALYIHFPWCARKCPYCDFNSHERDAPLPEKQLVDALVRDLIQDLPWVQGRALASIFMGGGTPSLISPRQVARLLSAVRRHIALAEDCEVTLEANPGTITATRLRGYREAGVNRLSLGVQSFDDRMLRTLGRIHDAAAARAAVAAAQQAGFARINLDLMHSLPGQAVGDALADLHEAIRLGPGHISWYELTIEPNTVFHSRPPVLPDEDTQWAILRRGSALLAERYQRYEISAFCRPGEECKHNRNYWEFGDYLGIGPGAHGKITLPERDQILRTVKYKRPDRYLAADGSYLAQAIPIATAQRPLEFLLNALRLTGGVGRTRFERRCGLPISVLDGFRARALQRGLLRKGTRLRPTRKGLRYLNDLLGLV